MKKNFIQEIAEAKRRKAERAGALQTPTQTTAREDTDKEISEDSSLADIQSIAPATGGSSGSGDGDPQPVVYASLEEIDKIEDSSARLRARIAFHREQKEMKEKLATLRKQGPVLPELPSNLDDLGLGDSDKAALIDNKQHIRNLDALTAMQRFTMKTPKPTRHNGGDSNKFRCPWPGHPDERPDAWFNVQNNTWFCGPCQAGGDWIDLYAAAHGYTQIGQQSKNMPNDQFGKMIEEIEKLLGLPSGRIEKPASPTVTITVPEDSATQVTEEQNEPEDSTVGPTYDVNALGIPEVSFLGYYLKEALKADVPREFPLFAGLAALSVTLGRDLALKLIEEPTYANLAICLTSPSGTGKGRTTRPVGRLLRDALPHDPTPLSGGLPAEGVRVMKLPGSAESLIDNLSEGQTSSPALVEFEEMQMLVGKGAGNSSYKSYIIEFADCLPLIARSSLEHGKGSVVNGYVTFLTATQPQHLRDQFTRRDEGSGLLNRFIFPFGNPVEQNAWEVTPQDWSNAITELKLLRKYITGWPTNSADGKAHWIYTDQWDADAKALWIKEFKTRIEPDRTGENANLLARMSVNMLRLILLFAANAISNRIKVEFVETAFKLYDYIKACALSLAKEIRATEMSEGMRAFLETVIKCEKKNGKPATRREMDKASSVIKNMNDEEFAKISHKLMAAKMLHHVQTKSKTGKGRPGDAYTSDMSQWANASVSVTEVTPK